MSARKRAVQNPNSAAMPAAIEYENKNVRVSRTRRRRGYDWEDTIVKRFNGADGWKAFRLGSPSVSLPDVLAVSTKQRSLFVIEAKSGTTASLRVPADQIERCRLWANTFDIYGRREVVLAFKFLAKRRIGTGRYGSRRVREFFKLWDTRMRPADCSCSYDGVIRLTSAHGRASLNLEDCRMPFAVRSAVHEKRKLSSI